MSGQVIFEGKLSWPTSGSSSRSQRPDYSDLAINSFMISLVPP
ncbi:hypothetical protein ACVW1A_002310 [Bradyrhizobium sp. LB1.3]